MAEEAWTGVPMGVQRPTSVAKSPDEAIAGESFTLVEAGLLGPVQCPEYMHLQPAPQPRQAFDWRERIYPGPGPQSELSLQEYLTGHQIPMPSAGGGVLGVPPLKVEEQDGTPSVTGVDLVKVPDGTLADLGNGDVSLNYESPINKGQPNGYASLDGATKLPLAQLPVHKDTHKAGGADAFVSTDFLEAIVKRLREEAGPTDLTMGAVADGQFLKRSGAAIVGQSQVFGNDSQSAVSAPRSTTTSAVFQNKVTLTTPALTGTYRLAWHAVVDNFGNLGEFRLQNTTDGATLGATVVWKTNDNDNRLPVGGFAEVVFAGAAKSFAVQFRARSAGDTQGIQDARIELWRVA